MTYQSTGGSFLVPDISGPNLNPSISFASILVNADGEGLGFIFEAPVTDTITKIGFRTGTVTTGGDVRVSVQTVDSGFLPSGTDWDTNTFLTQAILSTDDNTTFEVTLTAAASVTKGDLVAIVVERPTGSSFDGNLTNVGTGAYFNITGRPAPVAKVSASWSLAASVANVWPVFGTNGYVNTGLQNGVTGLNTVNYSTSTTPDVVGNVIRFPYDVKVSHIYAVIDFDGAFDFQILDSDGSTVLASTSNTATQPTSTGATHNFMQLSTEIELSANTDYRVVAIPTSSTNSAIFDIVFHNEDLRAISMGAEFCYKTSAKDPTGAGDYTDFTDTIVPIGVKVSAINIPTGGGGGLAANPIKGFIS